VGSASAAAAAAAAYQSPLLYGPTPSWMGTENFPGMIQKKNKKERSIEK
ncbi:unnamed protein product, partial [Rotaria socialis]